MTSFGLCVRHEKTLLPGLLLVRRVASFYPAFDARLEPAAEGRRLRIHKIASRSDALPNEVEVELAENVYF